MFYGFYSGGFGGFTVLYAVFMRCMGEYIWWE